MDINVTEKRKIGQQPPRRRVRSRTDDSLSQILTSSTPPREFPSAPIPPTSIQDNHLGQSQSVQVEEIPNEEMSNVQSQSHRQYRMQSVMYRHSTFVLQKHGKP